MSIFTTLVRKLSLRSSNVRMFLFFLVCTSVLWILIQFSKKYTRVIEVQLAYEGLPKGMLLNPESDASFKMLLHGNGFRLIRYVWNTPVLTFKLSEATVQASHHYHFIFDKQKELIRHKLGFDGDIVSIQNDTIKVLLDESLRKTIPVGISAKIQFAPGFGSGEEIQIEPDSVQITGPKQYIDTLQKIKTQTVVWKDLNSNYSTYLPLESIAIPSVSYTPKEVKASIKVSKFTEGQVEIPIQLRNVPEAKKIKIFPKTATLKYKVALHQYHTIVPTNFMVIADYASRVEEQSFLLLTIVKSPAVIHDLKLQERQVQFVVLK